MKVSTPSTLKIPIHLDQEFRTSFGSLEGWCTKEKAEHLMQLVLSHKPKKVVEIGVYGGKSLIPLALAVRWLGRDNPQYNGLVIGIDPWCKDASLVGDAGGLENTEFWSKLDYESFYAKTMDAIKKNNLDKEVMIFRNKAQEVVDKVSSVDFLHIDGNHSEETSCADVDLWMPKLTMGGIVVFDDTNWASTKSAAEKLEAWCGHLEDCGTYAWGRKIAKLK